MAAVEATVGGADGEEVFFTEKARDHEKAWQENQTDKTVIKNPFNKQIWVQRKKKKI